MSIYKGLFTPYLLNRKLTEQEKRDRLCQGQPHPDNPLVTNDDTVIKMNSTYLETIDRYYTFKGFPSLISFLMTIVFLIGLICFSITSFLRHVLRDEPLESGDSYLIVFCIIFLFFTVCATSSVFLKEWFRKTHYPIRFNRKTQMVYVYQVNGTVLVAPWSDIFFTLYEGKGIGLGWGIDGHILADDKETVLQTFSLGIYDSKVNIPGYWEFIRCYMEEDVLDELPKTIFLCHPISEKKESYIYGLQYILRVDTKWDWFYKLLLVPYYLLESFSRYIAMQTSKIPQWPEEVEEKCEVAVDDPVNVSYKNNIPYVWRYFLANLKMKDHLKYHKQQMKAVQRIKRRVTKRHKIQNT
ncbi:hypothetical protein J8V57_16325 [Xenorhabdus sp. PB61.4]|uniref:DUF6708 domain-containing protein n=1 Tax=Xenorhabdus sp. PB61.4 TaxID=2788940 RepID=UPI001E651EF0|nr:DUF6708 domain-containing protein [Xenorhabdus sp. PB61.4]MCC8367817.1 hypothetical protein [Xenorhabdus sp. PB61.4]